MKKAVVLCVCLSIVVGCARNISTSTYDARTLGAVSSTYYCTVVSQRRVMVEEGERLEDNKTGGIIGAITGGVLGNAVGGGRGRVVTTAAGAVAGAVAGAYAEKSLKSQEAIEYVVKLDSASVKTATIGYGSAAIASQSSLVTVVQGTDVILAVGQKALLIVDSGGRSRLIAQ